MAAVAHAAARRRRSGRRAGRRPSTLRPEPLPRSPSSAISTTGRWWLLGQPRGDDPDHARMPALAGQHVGARASAELAPRSALRPRSGCASRPARRSGLARSSSSAICAARSGSSVSSSSSPASARYRRPAAFRRGASAKATARSSTLPGSTARDGHQRAQPGLGGAGQRAQAAAHERAVLAEQRHHVGDRRQRHQVEIAARARRSSRPARSRQRLGELVGDGRRAQIGARVAAQRRMHDRRVGQHAVGARAWWSVTTTSIPSASRARDLLDGRDRAVDGDQQPRAALRRAARPSPRLSP